MTFDDLNSYLGEADAAMKACKSKESEYTTNAPLAIEAMTAAKTMLTNALRLSDIEEIITAYKEARKKILKATQYNTKVTNYLEDTLANDITEAANNVFKYRQFRAKLQKDLIADKLDIVAGIIQLQRYLEDMDSCEETRKRIGVFLQKMQTLNFYEVTSTNKTEIIKAFSEATKTSWFQSHGSLIEAAEGVHSGNLSLLLDKAIEYTKKSGQYWAKCHDKREELDNNKFVIDYQKKLKVKKYKQQRQVLLVELEKAQNDLKKKIKSMAPDNADEILKNIAATKIPESLNLLKKTYNLAKWVYENLDESDGEELGLPKEEEISHKFETPSLSVEYDVPVFSCGIADLVVEFGASFGGSLEFKAALTLHNFLSDSEDNYVSGSLSAEAKVEAEAFVGVGVTIVQLIKASGRFVLTGEAGVKALADVAIKKAEAEIAAFHVGAEAGISFKLAGHLEAVIGLTAPLKAIIKTVTGKSIEAKFKTDDWDFFTAERKANVSFDLPFRKKPVAFPKDMFSKSAGNWEVKFIGDTYLKKFWADNFGSKSKWDEVTSGHPLSAKELEEIVELYGNFGVRA